MTTVCGVDGCRAGWMAVFHDLERAELWWRVAPSLNAIASCTPRPEVIAVDVPIGLPDTGSRACDLEARRLLRARASSVFPAPIRAILAASSYPEGSAARRAIEGKGLSIQAWCIVPKIREVDDCLRSTPALRRIVREVHPELCFLFLNERQPMSHSKKKRAGREERLRALQPLFGGAVDTALTARLVGCQTDDVLDAFAAVWSAARIAQGQSITIPDRPPHDRFDLPMEMVV